MPRPDQPPMGAGESAAVPSAAAIANAIFDATGVRFREVPFSPERIKAGLAQAALPGPPPPEPPEPPRKRGWRAAFAGAFAALAGVAVAALPFHAATDPVARAEPGLYSPGAIARGRVLAALGDCAVCHTAPGGAAYAGGLGLDTPFGRITTPNITPDPRHRHRRMVLCRVRAGVAARHPPGWQPSLSRRCPTRRSTPSPTATCRRSMPF